MCCTQAYKPRIRFPPRYTPDGRRISSLPAEEAARALVELEAGDGAAAPTAPPEEEQPQQSQQVCYRRVLRTDAPPCRHADMQICRHLSQIRDSADFRIVVPVMGVHYVVIWDARH